MFRILKMFKTFKTIQSLFKGCSKILIYINKITSKNNNGALVGSNNKKLFLGPAILAVKNDFEPKNR